MIRLPEITTDLRQAKTKYFNDLFCEIETTKAYGNLVKKATAPKQQTVVGPLKTVWSPCCEGRR